MDRTRRRAVTARAAAVVAGAAVGLAGCLPTPKATWTEGPPLTTQAPPGLESYYSQTLGWAGCDQDRAFSTGVDQVDQAVGLASLQCAWLTVPLDYADPSGQTIKLAVARSVAKHRRGSVVINPGGPGGSGVDYVSTIVDGAGDSLRDSLDVVGFDPRGAGRSAPVTCLDTAGMDAFLAADADTTTAEGVAQAEASIAAFGAACSQNTGPLLAHVDTISAARDMDVLRAALREPTLTYLGISYGTMLGATYAELFPDRVGRMVLDGALDPTATPGQQNVIQAGGFESALRAYVTNCLAGEDCPVSGSPDEAMTQIVDLVEQARTHPLSTSSDRQVTASLAATGVMTALYSKDTWMVLSMALKAAIDQQDGTYLLLLADSYASRCDGITCPFKDGYYSNMLQANIAINCADARPDADPAVVADELAQTKQAAPHLWPYFTPEVDGCADWPTPVVGSLPSYTAKGAPPIVVVGTTNDPATPYAWAQALATMLDSGVLVTNQGEGHAAYLGGSTCIQTAVDGYLVDGTVPKDGLTC